MLAASCFYDAPGLHPGVHLNIQGGDRRHLLVQVLQRCVVHSSSGYVFLPANGFDAQRCCHFPCDLTRAEVATNYRMSSRSITYLYTSPQRLMQPVTDRWAEQRRTSVFAGHAGVRLGSVYPSGSVGSAQTTETALHALTSASTFRDERMIYTFPFPCFIDLHLTLAPFFKHPFTWSSVVFRTHHPLTLH